MSPSGIQAQLGTVTHWIGGKTWDGSVARWGDVFNPAIGEPSARVAFADQAVVDLAVATAAKAQQSWGNASLAVRTSNPQSLRYSANPSRVSPWSSTMKQRAMFPALQGPVRS